MEDVFDVLAEDHEEIRQALAELEKGPTAASGASEDQLMLRMIMTEELILEEAKHEEIELTCIWPAVRGQIPGGDQIADRAVCAELEIVALLAELNQADVSRPEFERLLGALTQAAREHFDFEERQVWPRLRSVLTAKATDELAGRILVARQAVPVPPFPRASASSS
jgi:hemerythrin-like domain-containing protein